MLPTTEPSVDLDQAADPDNTTTHKAVEPTTKGAKDRASLTRGLSRYGPWGYLMLGMLLCGGALLMCGLWGKFNMTRRSFQNILYSTKPISRMLLPDEKARNPRRWSANRVHTFGRPQLQLQHIRRAAQLRRNRSATVVRRSLSQPKDRIVRVDSVHVQRTSPSSQWPPGRGDPDNCRHLTDVQLSHTNVRRHSRHFVGHDELTELLLLCIDLDLSLTRLPFI